MKKIISISLSLALIVVSVSSCENELPTHFDFNSYNFSDLDVDGGSWQPILLSSATDIELAAPAEVNSAEYQAELSALKSATQNLTGNQAEAVQYWTNNPIIRWNEIALELATKYNLIPPPNPDGSYTLPTAANPEGPPPFPFAHPPYTSRMLAYLSVAQFDGLITAWHYKYEYNRPAPYVTDTDIQYAYKKNTLPSYPSDGAVIAIVSRDILKAMFPLEHAYLDARAEEHLNSLIWSGSNTASDIEAGTTIGTAVKTVALARASTDKMSAAQTPRALSDQIKQEAFDRFGWAWDNMEVPVRPVGLTPRFGEVTMWSVPNVEDVRVPVPPAPGSPAFETDAKELNSYAKNISEGQRKIANWWSDGLGTYTPPGHWNRRTKEYIVKYEMNPLRAARTFAYLNMAIMDAGVACWDSKYYYHYPRPIQTIKGFKTILGTPNFPSYPSGHSTFSGAAAEVLSYIFPAEANGVRSWAREAAESRIYGGIHYRFDSDNGLEQGKQVAAYTITRAQNDGADD
ncbi:MAG: phosphoesterase PA-phosphatase-like protein [Bacteroidetes bacterium OLB12]|nr:MAG: phosphoesterase PA-phosphatase-like protein [Bacteroidetes bacterium OLB12]HNR73008.1 phosphatase PAP2 family protein [Cyclobacteriaceae bacterium]HNU41072.1 phosphatase PAP2 family protein [Cyclobacteriaceae bacterium]